MPDGKQRDALPKRRDILALTAAIATVSQSAATATVIKDRLPWSPHTATPPPVAEEADWRYFSHDEVLAIEAIVDRLIPPDPETPGGKECGCAIFIDRQLAGPYGQDEGHYVDGPFHTGTKEQGPQSPLTPARQYRDGLAALDRYCKSQFDGASFVSLPDARKDEVLKGLEDGSITLEGIEGKQFFNTVLIDTQQGFFSDPVYGGNKDMASWKMIGFPGARYDYRDWVHRHNERFPLPPVSIRDHPNWKP